MNTIENIINEHDYLLDPDEDGEMVTLDEDLGSGSGDKPMDNKKMIGGIDPGLLESSNDAIIVNNDVEPGSPIAKVANHRCNLGFIKKLPAVGFIQDTTCVFDIFFNVIFCSS